MGNKRVIKSEILKNVRKTTGMKPKDVNIVYEAIISEIEKALIEGNDVMLYKFGSFVLKKHKGQPVQFGASRLEDYYVLKFDASDAVMDQINKNLKKNGTV